MSFSTNAIADKTLRALGVHISTTEYLEVGFLYFINIIDLEFNTKPAMVDNPGQVVMSSEEEMVKKNKCAAKRKKWLAKLYTPIRFLSSPCLKSSLFLLPYFMPAVVPSLVSAPMPAPVSDFGSPAVLSSHYVPTLISCLEFPAILLSHCVPTLVRSTAFSSSCHTLIFCCRIPALLLLFLSVLGPSLPLGFSSLKIFKRSLSDELQPYVSTSPAKPLYLFPAFATYNLNNKQRLV